ncbi:hypothetical protein EYF80_053934 [Liparis tanakae]|uniref:Uncharacterized protein n=1 Tax=Liparis tanakae TaxID=230148 RepID=A0A4Z2F602_9TELE|nr:hypothetical protein EYF80_053934 [Liparis tanakae]
MERKKKEEEEEEEEETSFPKGVRLYKMTLRLSSSLRVGPHARERVAHSRRCPAQALTTPRHVRPSR